MEPELVSLVQRFLRPCLRRGNVDAVADYAAQLPLRALARVLGLDEEGIEQARSVSARYVEAVAAADPDLAARLSAELDAFARTVVHSRLNATRPTQDDPLVQLLARSRSLEIGLDHVAGFVRALLVAADRSTTNALGSAIWHLARDLSLQQWLRDHPDSVPDAVEELFRLYPPTLATARTALCDVMIEGQRIRSGEVVAMVFFAANRDPEVFTDPDRFRLRRTHQHLSFGHGIHKCPGRDLARMLVCTALRELLTATRQFRLAGPVEFRRWPEFGPSRLPLYLRSAP
jgi:cytochrome P450